MEGDVSAGGSVNEGDAAVVSTRRDEGGNVTGGVGGKGYRPSLAVEDGVGGAKAAPVVDAIVRHGRSLVI